VERGDQGSYANVRDNLVRRLQFAGRKTPANALPKIPPLPTPRQATFLFLRHPEKLRVEEQETRVKLRQIHPEVNQAYDLVQQFTQMLRTRMGENLDAWLTQVENSNLPELQSFARYGSRKTKMR
jgi:transposase